MSGTAGRDRSAPSARSAPAAGSRASEGAPRQVSRSRLPLPPVPAASRPAPRTPTGPRTTAAPFAAVPSPEPRLELGRDVAFSAGVAIGAPLDRSAGSAPAIARPSRTLVEADAALVSTGPSAAGGFRSAPLPPRGPRQTGPGGTPSQGDGDWTPPPPSPETDPAH